MRLLLFGLVALPFMPFFARGEVTATIEEVHPLAASGEVLVENVNGPITIETSDTAEVRLQAVKSARTEADLKALEVQIEATATRFAVKTVYLEKDGSWLKKFTNTGEVRYTLTVPHGAALRRLETMNGAIAIANAHGRVTAKTKNGRINAQGLRDETELSTLNGDIDATFEAVGRRQDIVLESANGNVRLLLPREVGAEIAASTANGAIRNDFGLIATNENWVGQRMEGTVGDGAGRIRLKTINGAIEVRSR